MMTYTVSSRMDEIGIRQALGADAARVVGLFVGQGLRLAAVGVTFGFVLSWGAGRLAEGLLFGVEPLDPLIHASVAGFLILVAIAASSIPALRATRVSPLRALRKD